jgi:hypothetical protein
LDQDRELTAALARPTAVAWRGTRYCQHESGHDDRDPPLYRLKNRPFLNLFRPAISGWVICWYLTDADVSGTSQLRLQSGCIQNGPKVTVFKGLNAISMQPRLRNAYKHNTKPYTSRPDVRLALSSFLPSLQTTKIMAAVVGAAPQS